MQTSAERVQRIAATLNEIAVPLCLKRLEEMGERESGAYNFYAERLRRGTIFGDYELALVSALVDWPEAPTITHEIGCGYSTLSLLLGGLGFDCVAFEVDPRRYAGAVALLEGIRLHSPALAGSCQVLNQRFPTGAGAPPPTGALAITTNLVFTTTEMARSAIIEALAHYPWAIIDIDRFLTPIGDEAGRSGRLKAFEAQGLVGSPFLDLGARSCFYRFGDGSARAPARPESQLASSAWLGRFRALTRRRLAR
jgi:hypothetical protein